MRTVLSFCFFCFCSLAEICERQRDCELCRISGQAHSRDARDGDIDHSLYTNLGNEYQARRPFRRVRFPYPQIYHSIDINRHWCRSYGNMCPGMRPRCAAEEPTPREGELLEACACGDLASLQHFFSTTPLPNRDEPSWDPYHPNVFRMLITAIARKQALIVAYLLERDPSIKATAITILDTAFDHPDLETFKLLHAHSPEIVNQEWQYIFTTLGEACACGDPALPAYLLDNGADPSQGGPPGGGPLYSALVGAQPLELIKRLVEHGAIVSFSVQYRAIDDQRLDVLQFILDRGPYDPWGNLLKKAHKSRNPEIIAMVKKRGRNLTKADKWQRAEKKRWQRNHDTDKKSWQFWRRDVEFQTAEDQPAGAKPAPHIQPLGLPGPFLQTGNELTDT